MKFSVRVALVAVSVCGVVFVSLNAADKVEKSDPELDRTRKQVQMLDDIYKHAVVLITTHYVQEDTDLPAGTAAKALFSYAKKQGYHDVRLLDVAGEPINDENVARKGFEQDAVKALKAGETWYERVEEKDGKRMLHAATPIPVVLEKCIMCHENYRTAKKGEAIGALSYLVPIE